MIDAITPYIWKYTSPKHDEVKILKDNKIVEVFKSVRYIDYLYYHSLTGAVRGVGVDNYVGVLENQNGVNFLNIFDCSNNRKTLISNQTLPPDFENLKMYISEEGGVFIEYDKSNGLSLEVTLFDVLQSLAFKIGYSLNVTGKINNIKIEGVNFATNTNVYKAIQILAEFLAVDLQYNTDNTINIIAIDVDESIRPILIEEKEHAINVIYGEKSSDAQDLDKIDILPALKDGDSYCC